MFPSIFQMRVNLNIRIMEPQPTSGPLHIPDYTPRESGISYEAITDQRIIAARIIPQTRSLRYYFGFRPDKIELKYGYVVPDMNIVRECLSVRNLM